MLHILLIVLSAAWVAGPALAQKRIALVIGNDSYENLPKLQKAAADARAYAEVLREKGYIVRERFNVTRNELDQNVADFIAAIEPGDTAAFIYAGHGWSDGSINYVVPVDAPAAGAQDYLARFSTALKNGANGVLDEMDKRKARLTVAIIDACRNNPFSPAPGQRSGTVGLGRGLAPMRAEAGTFVIFSAKSGETALDRLSETDPDRNSVFTRVFLPMMRDGLTLQTALKDTQVKVEALARSVNAEQRPSYYDEVSGPACMFDMCKSASDSPSASLGPDQAESVWFFISISTDPEQIKAFIAQFPNSPRRPSAEARLKLLLSKAPQQTASLTPPVVTPPALEPPGDRPPTGACPLTARAQPQFGSPLGRQTVAVVSGCGKISRLYLAYSGYSFVKAVAPGDSVSFEFYFFGGGDLTVSTDRGGSAVAPAPRAPAAGVKSVVLTWSDSHDFDLQPNGVFSNPDRFRAQFDAADTLRLTDGRNGAMRGVIFILRPNPNNPENYNLTFDLANLVLDRTQCASAPSQSSYKVEVYANGVAKPAYNGRTKPFTCDETVPQRQNLSSSVAITNRS